jgi:hypothetical protein
MGVREAIQSALGEDKAGPNPFVTRNNSMIPELPQRPAIRVGKLKEVLVQVPDDHCLVPSQVYDFFIVDKDGHNRGYVSASGELHWWAAENK